MKLCVAFDASDDAPRLAAPYDDSDPLWCQLENGHDGPHRWTHEWTDSDRPVLWDGPGGQI